MTYRTGELDQLITIQRESRSADGMGGASVSLTTVVSGLWAHVRPRSGKEIAAFDRVQASALYLFVVRYRDDIREDDRAVWDGETYNIRAILTRGARSNWLEFEAERGVTQ